MYQLDDSHLDLITRILRRRSTRGRPWAHSLRWRIRLVVLALRTNLTIREIGALFRISKSQVHRILADITPKLAACLERTVDMRRSFSWVVDGTLVPTRDHRFAAKSKNYRYSCNLQVLARRADLRVVAIAGGGPGNRNDPMHYRGSSIEAMCRLHGRVLADGGYRGVAELVTPRFWRNRILRNAAWRRHRKRRARIEHAIAWLKNWRVLRDHRRRGHCLLDTARAVAFLHNLGIVTRSRELRDKS